VKPNQNRIKTMRKKLIIVLLTGELAAMLAANNGSAE
jgi:hypothetical protein